MMNETGYERLCSRQKVLLSARRRRSGWSVFQVDFDDISHAGCSIVGKADSFRAGEDVSLRFPNLKPIAARVRWTLADRVGIEFNAALSSQIVSELGTRFALAGG